MCAAVPERFRSRLVIDDGCWLWQGYVTRKGYGNVGWQGHSRLLHRVVWEQAHGPVAEGFVLHHLCRRKACCNPEHLCLVTNAENRRLDRRTVCKKGLHEMTIENRIGGGRCRACQNAWRRTRLRELRGDKFGVWADRKRVLS